jgi:S-adenosylmethionine:tRNA ribosyltransferase-isomerase
LHFTLKNLEKLKERGIELAYLTLHVGVGTFKPVKSDNVLEHKMEKEFYCVPEESAQKIKKAREHGCRICAVGTTSCRSLETFAVTGKPSGWTDLFIYPGYDFKLTDSLLTNFHLPRTTLFMLVCAFAGRDLMHKAYAEAVKERYRFYSYGDAMLVI